MSESIPTEKRIILCVEKWSFKKRAFVLFKKREVIARVTKKRYYTSEGFFSRETGNDLSKKYPMSRVRYYIDKESL